MLKDIYNRYFSYLRLSITDLCNFKCKYCLPENVNLKKKHYLSVKEIYNLVSAFVDLGINKIRLTGGEPTVRKDFFEIGKIIAKFSKIRSLVFTTNGYKLNRIVNTLCSIGFTGINVSLDTLSKKKFYIITKRDYFNNVFEGVLLALELILK